MRGSSAAAYSANMPPSPQPMTPILPGCWPAVLDEPVNARQDFLQFVSDQVPAQLEGRPVEELPVGQRRAAMARLQTRG